MKVSFIFKHDAEALDDARSRQICIEVTIHHPADRVTGLWGVTTFAVWVPFAPSDSVEVLRRRALERVRAVAAEVAATPPDRIDVVAP